MFDSSTVSIGAPTKRGDYMRLLQNSLALLSGLTDVSESMAGILSGTASFSGPKTFYSGTVFAMAPKLPGVNSLTATHGVSIATTYRNASGTHSVKNLRFKLLEIGNWNMNATAICSIPHGLPDFKKIVGLLAAVRKDNEEGGPECFGWMTNGGDYQQDLGFQECLTSTVVLVRFASGRFTGPTYDQVGGYNRGWVVVFYYE